MNKNKIEKRMDGLPIMGGTMPIVLPSSHHNANPIFGASEVPTLSQTIDKHRVSKRLRVKDEELRIGNIIADSTKTTTRVETIIPYYDRKQYNKSLTEEYLLAFGFYKNGIEYSLKGVVVLFEHGMFKYHFNLGFEDFVWLRSVHQLQNLYYILIGKELELKY